MKSHHLLQLPSPQKQIPIIMQRLYRYLPFIALLCSFSCSPKSKGDTPQFALLQPKEELPAKTLEVIGGNPVGFAEIPNVKPADFKGDRFVVVLFQWDGPVSNSKITVKSSSGADLKFVGTLIRNSDGKYRVLVRDGFKLGDDSNYHALVFAVAGDQKPATLSVEEDHPEPKIAKAEIANVSLSESPWDKLQEQIRAKQAKSTKKGLDDSAVGSLTRSGKTIYWDQSGKVWGDIDAQFKKEGRKFHVEITEDGGLLLMEGAKQYFINPDGSAR